MAYQGYPPVQQQPGVVYPQGGPPPATDFKPQGGRDWSSGLFSCFDDMESCCLTYWCGQFYICHMMHTRFDEHCCNAWPCCLGPLGSILALRYRMRHEHGIEGSLMNDFCTVLWCGACATCQLKREKDVLDGGRR